MDVQYAVGRIHFGALKDYANYSASVVTAEKGETILARKAAFFGVGREEDRATKRSSEMLVEPLRAFAKEDQPTWSVTNIPPA